MFRRLDALEDRLSDGRRFLLGDLLTEADVRLFTTLVRFDAGYHNHFRCNRNKITEMPAVWAYGVSSRRPASARRWTSVRSRRTTTGRTRPSTRRASSPRALAPQGGLSSTTKTGFVAWFSRAKGVAVR